MTDQNPPDWNPPDAGHVPVRRTKIDETIRSAQAVVTITEVSVYATGLLIVLDCTAFAEDDQESVGDLLRDGMQSADYAPAPAALEFVAELDDGTNINARDTVLWPASQPERPFLTTVGGAGFRINGPTATLHQQLWLWTPEGPPGQVRIKMRWPRFDIDGSFDISNS